MVRQLSDARLVRSWTMRLTRAMATATFTAMTATLLVTGTLALAVPAHATVVKTWADPVAVTDTSSNAGQILASPTGQLFLYDVTAYGGGNGTPTLTPLSTSSQLGTEEPLPPYRTGRHDFTALGPAVFLPNGDAVLSWNPLGSGLAVVYRFANGTFGPVTYSNYIYQFAVNAGELLTSAGGSVQSYTIGADGGFTLNGPPQTLDPSSSVDASLVTLDAGGSAEFLSHSSDSSNASTYEVTSDFTRATSTSAWVKGAGYGVTGAFKGVLGPGGAAAVGWLSGTTTSTTLTTVLRQPGGSFGSATPLTTVTAADSAQLSHLTFAGGPDDTMAVGVSATSCTSGSATTVGNSKVFVAPPGQPFGGAMTVPGSTLSSTSATALTSLGAGDGTAVAGISVKTETDTPQNPCSASADPPNSSASFGDQASVLGADGGSRSFGSTTVSQTPSGTVGDSNIGTRAVGLDTAGDAAAFGSLTQPSTFQVATFGTPPGDGSTPGTPTPSPTPSGSSMPTPAASTPTTTATATGSTAPTGPAPTLPTPTLTATRPSASKVKTHPNGSVSLTLSLPKTAANANETLILQAKSGKTFQLAKKTVTLRSGKSVTVTLTLGSSARKWLAAHPQAKVGLLLSAVAKGHKLTTKTIGLRLTLPAKLTQRAV